MPTPRPRTSTCHHPYFTLRPLSGKGPLESLMGDHFRHRLLCDLLLLAAESDGDRDQIALARRAAAQEYPLLAAHQLTERCLLAAAALRQKPDKDGLDIIATYFTHQDEEERLFIAMWDEIHQPSAVTASDPEARRLPHTRRYVNKKCRYLAWENRFLLPLMRRQTGSNAHV